MSPTGWGVCQIPQGVGVGGETKPAESGPRVEHALAGSRRATCFWTPQPAIKWLSRWREQSASQIGAQTLRHRLREHGLLASVDVGREMLLVRRTLEGTARQVLHLKTSDLMSLAAESE